MLNLLSQDSEAAFTEIYNRFWRKLFAVAYNRLKVIQLAEDIVHDVFADLWARRKKLEIDLPENYLATAVKYAVLAKIKEKEKEKVFQRSPHLAPVKDLPAETALHFKLILEIVKSEVNRLPEKCRLIFKYSRDKGMPVKEIARELNISPKTVENQMGKAIKHLRLAIKNFFHSFLF